MSAGPTRYVAGLDLGLAQEFTALAVLERTVTPDPGRPGRQVSHYAGRHLERFPLGTPYTDVCQRLARLFAGPPLAGSPLAVDQTAVGQPVLEVLRRAKIGAAIRPVTVTGGHAAGADDRGGWLVPKKELVSTLQVLLQSRRIKVAAAAPEAETLVRELVNFRTKVPASAADTLEAWREGVHDDLVLAVAIAAWVGERGLRRLHVFV